jgi:hypothetical protein
MALFERILLLFSLPNVAFTSQELSVTVAVTVSIPKLQHWAAELAPQP